MCILHGELPTCDLLRESLCHVVGAAPAIVRDEPLKEDFCLLVQRLVSLHRDAPHLAAELEDWDDGVEHVVRVAPLAPHTRERKHSALKREH
eukprot:scaffold324540_cov75-Tisochrysis_lutea.AAC.1